MVYVNFHKPICPMDFFMIIFYFRACWTATAQQYFEDGLCQLKDSGILRMVYVYFHKHICPRDFLINSTSTSNRSSSTSYSSSSSIDGEQHFSKVSYTSIAWFSLSRSINQLNKRAIVNVSCCLTQFFTLVCLTHIDVWHILPSSL